MAWEILGAIMPETQISQEEKDVIQGLRDEILFILDCWQLFRQLFGTSEERINILGGVSPKLFGTFQKVLLDYVLLTIGKLTDHARTGGQENLSFENAINLLRKRFDENMLLDLENELDDLFQKCERITAIRNKYLAHFDKAVYMTELNVASLPGVSRADIDSIFTLMKTIMNKMEELLGIPKMLYDFVDHKIGDNFIWYLEQCGSYRQVYEKHKEAQVQKKGFIS